MFLRSLASSGLSHYMIRRQPQDHGGWLDTKTEFRHGPQLSPDYCLSIYSEPLGSGAESQGAKDKWRLRQTPGESCMGARK